MLVPVRLANEATRLSETKGEGEGREEQKVNDTGTFPTDGRSADLHTASALLNIGDKVL
jgi:hypothetical protein